MTGPHATPDDPARPLRVAIACPGVGVVQRGFERFFGDIFELLRQDLDVTLFKGGGPETPNEKVLPFIRRGGRLVKVVPIHRLFGRAPMHTECLTFALAILPYLWSGQFDVVHTIDPPLTRILFYFRKLFGLEFRLLYTEGCAMAPADYPPADHIQQVAEAHLDDAAAFGHPREGMTLLPCGFHSTRFEAAQDRETLRRAHGVDDDTFLILSVAAINRSHKRIDHLIDEVARLDGKLLLWLDGSLDHGDPDLLVYARERLGDRCRITHVASAQVGDLYRMADVMAHAATYEAFGLAIVEAAGSGVPLLVHDDRHFRWLLPNPGSWVDMTEPGALAARLQALMADRSGLEALRDAQGARERFDWQSLRAQYADLYRRVSTMPMASGSLRA